MNFSLLKKNSIFSFQNSTSLTRRANTFVKTLGIYNYKKGPNKQHKNPHAIPLKTYIKLRKNSNSVNDKKFRYLKLNSSKPFGKFDKNKFRLDYSKIPLYDIPNTSGFYLKPYLSENNKFFSQQPEDLSNKPTMQILSKIRTQMLFSKDPEVVNLGVEIFETKFGKNICKEFITNSNSGRVFDRRNPFFKQNFFSMKKEIQRVNREKVNRIDVLKSIYPTEAEINIYSEEKEDILSIIDKKVLELESQNNKIFKEVLKDKEKKKESKLNKKLPLENQNNIDGKHKETRI